LGWTFSHGRTGARVLTEVLAKLLGLVVVLWATLLSGGPVAGRSPTKQGEVVRRFAWRVVEAVPEVTALEGVLGRLAQELERIPPQIKRRKRPSTRQLLQEPSLAA